MSKVYERILLRDYLKKTNFEKHKFDRVSIVLAPDEVCRAYGPKGDHVHWQNVVDAIAKTDAMCTDGLSLNDFFVNFYKNFRAPIDGSHVLILYLGKHWNGSC